MRKLNEKGVVELAVGFVIFGFVAAVGFMREVYIKEQKEQIKQISEFQAPVTEQYILQSKKYRLIENKYQHQLVQKPKVCSEKNVCTPARK